MFRAYEAYQEANVSTDPRQAERQKLGEVTRNLVQAAQIEGFSPLVHEAIYYTRKLWGIFAAEMMMPENPYPAEAKATILKMARIVDHHAEKALSEDGPERARTINLLVEINRTIMRGLAPTAA